MRLYEWEAKALLKAQGIAVPEGFRVQTPHEAVEAATKLGGPAVIKAQIPSGRRTKAGGVRFASNAEEAGQMAAALLGQSLLGSRVDEVLVEEQAVAAQELFLAITYESVAKAPVILASTEGGMEIERTVAGTPSKLVRQVVNMAWPFTVYQAREIAIAMGLTGRNVLTVGDVVQRLYELFYRYDATLLEINPLARVAVDRLVALDAHIELDDEALGRHPELTVKWGIRPRPTEARPPTLFEQAAARIDATDHRGVAGRVVEFDGDLGLLIGGGGASLAVFDAILAQGGRPANYCEIGGNPSVRKIQALTQLVLSKPGVRKLAVIMNVVSNTRVDLVARGVIRGIVEMGMNPKDILTVFRVPGAWESEGFQILRHYEVDFCDRSVSLDEAARLAVEKSRS